MTAARLPAWARPKDMLDLTRLAVPVAMSRASFMLMGADGCRRAGAVCAGAVAAGAEWLAAEWRLWASAWG